MLGGCFFEEGEEGFCCGELDVFTGFHADILDDVVVEDGGEASDSDAEAGSGKVYTHIECVSPGAVIAEHEDFSFDLVMFSPVVHDEDVVIGDTCDEVDIEGLEARVEFCVSWEVVACAPWGEGAGYAKKHDAFMGEERLTF